MSTSTVDHTLVPPGQTVEPNGEAGAKTESALPSDANAAQSRSGDSEASEPSNTYLSGIRLYYVIATLLISMLLIGLDINIVATVNWHPTNWCKGVLAHQC